MPSEFVSNPISNPQTPKGVFFSCTNVRCSISASISRSSFRASSFVLPVIRVCAYSGASRHPIPIDSATPWRGCRSRWINPMKTDRALGKNLEGQDDGRKVIHAYHKRSSPVKVGEGVKAGYTQAAICSCFPRDTNCSTTNDIARKRVRRRIVSRGRINLDAIMGKQFQPLPTDSDNRSQIKPGRQSQPVRNLQIHIAPDHITWLYAGL